MSAFMPLETPVAERICAQCRWSRDASGATYGAGDRAYCAEPDVKSDDGTPVECERMRFTPSSQIMHVCGFDGILFEAR